MRERGRGREKEGGREREGEGERERGRERERGEREGEKERKRKGGGREEGGVIYMLCACTVVTSCPYKVKIGIAPNSLYTSTVHMHS